MHIAQQSWGEVEPPGRHLDLRLPTGCAFGNSLIYQTTNAFELHRSDDGANIDSFVQGRTDTERAHAAPNFFHERLGDAFLHQQTRTRTANLSLIEPDSINQSFHRTVEISVLKDNKGRFAAKFEREPFVTLGTCSANRAPNLGGSSECNFVDAGMLYQRLAGGPIAGDDVDHSVRQADLLANLGKRQRGQRSELRRLQHRRVSGSNGRRNFPRQHEQWKIPRNDLSDDSAGGVVRKLSIQQLCPAGVMIKMADDQRDIDVAALTNRFPVIDGFKYREPSRMSLNGAGHGVQITGAGMRRKRLPRGKCFSRCLDRG